MAKYRPGVYEFTFRASTGSVVPISTQFKFNLTLVDPCSTAKILSTNLFSFADMSYTLGNEAIRQAYAVQSLFSLNIAVDCGLIGVEFVSGDGEPIDDKIFSVVTSSSH